MEARQREAEDEVHPEPLLEDDTMERYELSESDLRNLGAEDRIYRDDSEAAEHSNVERESVDSNLGDLYELDPSLFMQVSKDKKKLTRAEKRQQRQEFTRVKETTKQ